MPTFCSNTSACSIFLGNPSKRVQVLPCFKFGKRTSSITCWTCAGSTSAPADMRSMIVVSPRASRTFDLALSRSPTDTWHKPNSLASLVHCVPFPTPGPPADISASFGERVIDSCTNHTNNLCLITKITDVITTAHFVASNMISVS